MELLYTKYNRHRLPQFQIETSIFSIDGKRRVVKKILTPQASAHIRNLAHTISLIKENLADNNIHLPRVLAADETSISVSYVNGQSFDYMLFQAFLNKDKKKFLDILDEYIKLLHEGFKTTSHPFIPEQLKGIFGKSVISTLDSRYKPYFTLSMIDLVFENIFVNRGKYYVIDNEWVFEGSLPVSFAIFRSLFYFYNVKYVELDVSSLVPYESALKRYHIDPDIANCYRKMDEHFQEYVFGKVRYYSYKSNYAKNILSVPLLEKTIRQMSEQINHLTEVHLLLNQWIRDKDKELYYIKHSRGWKLLRFFCGTIDRLLPADSHRKRVIFSLVHLPIRAAQLLVHLFSRKKNSKA